MIPERGPGWIDEVPEVAEGGPYVLEWFPLRNRLKITRRIPNKVDDSVCVKWLFLDGSSLRHHPKLLELLAIAVDRWCSQMAEDR